MGKKKALVTALKLKEPPFTVLWVINCHMPGGPDGAGGRLQVAEPALKAVLSEAKALQLDPRACIFCGDLNSQGRTALDELLVNCKVTSEFLEQGKQATKSGKRNDVGRFVHAQRAVFGERMPATMLCPNVDSKMLRADGELTPEFTAALDAAFYKLSGGQATMDKAAVEKYLIAICRGEVSQPFARMEGDVVAAEKAREPWSYELKRMKEDFERLGEERLSRDAFIETYSREVKEGKFWLPEHDLRVLGCAGVHEPADGPCELLYDHLYFTPALRLLGVQAPLTRERMKVVFGSPWDTLPNEWHPSDHLPVAAVFALEQ